MFAIAKVVAEPVPPIDKPVIAPSQVKLVIVLLETEEAPPKKLTTRPVNALVPPVQLENVFPLNVFVGEPPSVFDQPAIVVAPVTVILEKLLLLLLIIEPVTEDELSAEIVIVPPAPVFANDVTIELLFIFLVFPVAANDQAFARKITLPVVLTDILVKVLLLILFVGTIAKLLIKVILPVPPVGCEKLLKSLPLIFSVVVAFEVVPSTIIPDNVFAILPPRIEIILLLTLLTIVPVGALVKAGT